MCHKKWSLLLIIFFVFGIIWSYLGLLKTNREIRESEIIDKARSEKLEEEFNMLIARFKTASDPKYWKEVEVPAEVKGCRWMVFSNGVFRYYITGTFRTTWNGFEFVMDNRDILTKSFGGHMIVPLSSNMTVTGSIDTLDIPRQTFRSFLKEQKFKLKAEFEDDGTIKTLDFDNYEPVKIPLKIR